MLSVLLYRLADSGPLAYADLEAAIGGLGAQLRQVSTHYRCGHWRCPETQAHIDIDIGRPLLAPPGAVGPGTHHDDPHAQPKDYPGWLPCEVSLHIPLTGPHWYVVEIAQWIGRLLLKLPGCGILISEDVGIEGEDDYGPGPVNGARLLACWESCHASQTSSLQLPRMERRSSLALWRYRRETGSERGPGVHWPQALVLGRDQQAFTTVLWSDPSLIWALPPVDYLTVQRGDAVGLLPSDELITAAGQAAALQARSAATIIQPSATVSHLFAHSQLMDPRPFTALSDHEWSD